MSMRKTGMRAGIALLATLVLGPMAVGAGFAGPSARATTPNPSNFTARVDNPWFPLKPDTTYVYRGVKDGQPARDVFTATHATKVVDGVRCVVVQDRLYLRGHLGERTTEWYSQDKQGNVWYFGEDTAELDKNGRITNTAGTWRAGVRGARPGILMFAHPKVGQSARQEYYKGQAEDHFRVLSLAATVKVRYTSSKHALLTKEWTPLEPRVIDRKFYVRGIGTVLEQTVKGGDEHFGLVAVRRGR